MAKLAKNRRRLKRSTILVKDILFEEPMVKDITFTKFDASVDIDIRLGVDPGKRTRW